MDLFFDNFRQFQLEPGQHVLAGEGGVEIFEKQGLAAGLVAPGLFFQAGASLYIVGKPWGQGERLLCTELCHSRTCSQNSLK